MELEHLNELKTSLAVITEKIDGVNEHLKKLNGKTDSNTTKIGEIDKDVSSSKSWFKGVGVVVFLLIASLVYAYQGDKKSLSIRTENVASELSQYQIQQSDKMDRIIILLSNKEVVNKIK